MAKYNDNVLENREQLRAALADIQTFTEKVARVCKDALDLLDEGDTPRDQLGPTISAHVKAWDIVNALHESEGQLLEVLRTEGTTKHG